MGLFFSSKTEKLIATMQKKGMDLEVRYLDGNKLHVSKIYKHDAKRFTISGFSERLREDVLDIRCKAANVLFESRVLAVSHDARGQLFYHCAIPVKVKPYAKRGERFLVYPKAVAVIPEDVDSEAGLEALHVGGRVKTLKLYIWDISRNEVDLVLTGKGMAKGSAIKSCKIILGDVESMVDLEVVEEQVKPYGKEKLRVVRCKFKAQPSNMDNLVAISRKVDGMNL